MRLGEFDLIDRLLKPLAAGEPGALGLADDAALLSCPAGNELVVAKDAIVAGVHFLEADPADTVGRKLLRVNLSDLAAMGAEPLCYLTVVARSDAIDDDWMTKFCAGLAADQEEFAIKLVGGDLVSTPGPLMLTCTMIGKLPEGQAIRRSGARPGDSLFVSGTLGDASAGLRIQRGLAASEEVSVGLIDRYRVPLPRLALGQGLRGVATSMIDISDGLLADLRHIADASGCRAVVDVESLPVSPLVNSLPGGRGGALDGGDDYELLFTADPVNAGAIDALARATGVPVTSIGRIEEGEGLADMEGKQIDCRNGGWRHF